MTSKQSAVRPYLNWSQEENARWIDAGNTFGYHLMEFVRDRALQKIAADISPEARESAEQAIDNALWGFMALLDGVTGGGSLGETYNAEYVLLIRVTDSNVPVETIELAPHGDGLCMGYAGWREGNFGQNQPDDEPS